MIYDEDDHHKEVYAYAGLALYKAQCLEVEVCNFLILHHIVSNRKITADERDAFINRAERQTLGRLLHEMRRVVNVDDDFEDMLANSLQKRNFFIHDYFRDRVAGFMCADSRDDLIKELQELASLFEQSDSRVQLLTNNARQALGLTDEHIRSVLADMFSEEVAERWYGETNAR